MAGARFAVMPVKCVGVCDFVGAALLQGPENIISRDRCLAGKVNLHPIAGCQEKRLTATDRSSQRVLGPIAGVTFTRLHVRSVMAKADAAEVHDVRWETKLIAHSTETATVKARMQRVAIRFGARCPRCRICK